MLKVNIQDLCTGNSIDIFIQIKPFLPKLNLTKDVLVLLFQIRKVYSKYGKVSYTFNAEELTALLAFDSKPLLNITFDYSTPSSDRTQEDVKLSKLVLVP